MWKEEAKKLAWKKKQVYNVKMYKRSYDSFHVIYVGHYYVIKMQF